MALIVLDSSVVIALLDEQDALHAAATAALLSVAADDLRLPASAYAECLVAPARRGALARARRRIGTLGLRVEPLTARVGEHAAQLRARFSALRLPDALVIATADILGADAMLTGDTRWRRFSSRTLVVNTSARQS